MIASSRPAAISTGSTGPRATRACGVGYGVLMLPVPALLPLETLPSWPTVTDPTALEMLTLTIFIPFGIGAVLTILIMGPVWRAKSE